MEGILQGSGGGEEDHGLDESEAEFVSCLFLDEALDGDIGAQQHTMLAIRSDPIPYQGRGEIIGASGTSNVPGPHPPPPPEQPKSRAKAFFSSLFRRKGSSSAKEGGGGESAGGNVNAAATGERKGHVALKSASQAERQQEQHSLQPSSSFSSVGSCDSPQHDTRWAQR